MTKFFFLLFLFSFTASLVDGSVTVTIDRNDYVFTCDGTGPTFTNCVNNGVTASYPTLYFQLSNNEVGCAWTETGQVSTNTVDAGSICQGGSLTDNSASNMGTGPDGQYTCSLSGAGPTGTTSFTTTWSVAAGACASGTNAAYTVTVGITYLAAVTVVGQTNVAPGSGQISWSESTGACDTNNANANAASILNCPSYVLASSGAVQPVLTIPASSGSWASYTSSPIINVGASTSASYVVFSTTNPPTLNYPFISSSTYSVGGSNAVFTISLYSNVPSGDLTQTLQSTTTKHYYGYYIFTRQVAFQVGQTTGTTYNANYARRFGYYSNAATPSISSISLDTNAQTVCTYTGGTGLQLCSGGTGTVTFTLSNFYQSKSFTSLSVPLASLPAGLQTVCSGALAIASSTSASCALATIASTTAVGQTPGPVTILIFGAASASVSSGLTVAGVTPPTVTSLSVSSSPGLCTVSGNNLVSCNPAGGSTLTITGTGFVSGATSNFCTGTVTIASSTSITCALKSGSLGSPVAVTVTTTSGTSSAGPTVTYAGAPTVSGLDFFSSNSADSCTLKTGGSGGTAYTAFGTSPGFDTALNCAAAGNVQITIYGTNFFGSLTSNVCTSSFTADSGSTSRAVCTMVSGTNGATLTPSVTSNSVTSTSNAATITFIVAAPVVSSLSVGSASTCLVSGNNLILCDTAGAASATALTITGSNFAAGATVDVGCTGTLTLTGSTQITCALAAGTAGTSISPRVTTTGGTSAVGPSLAYAKAPTVTGVDFASSGASDSCTLTTGGLGGTAFTSFGTSPGFDYAANCKINPSSITLTIYGTNFYGRISVPTTVCASSSATISSASASTDGVATATCTMAAGAAGQTTTVSVTSVGGTSTSNTGTIAYAGVPTITSFSISSAATCLASGNNLILCDTSGGSTLTFTGTNFASGVTVTAGNPCTTTPTFVSATQLTCTLASGTQGTTLSPQVTTNGGQSATGPTVSYAPLPTVTKLDFFSPAASDSCTLANGGTAYTAASGSGFTTATNCATAGGVTLTIYGTNFYGQGSAPLAACASGSVSIVSASTSTNGAGKATCTMASGSAGQATVTVSFTSNGGTSATNPASFTYLSAPTVTGISVRTQAGSTTICTLTDSKNVANCPISNQDSTSAPLAITFTGTSFSTTQLPACSICSSCNQNTLSTSATCFLDNTLTITAGTIYGNGGSSDFTFTTGTTTVSMSTSGIKLAYASPPTVSGLDFVSSGTTTCLSSSAFGGSTPSTALYGCLPSGGATNTLTIIGTNFYGTLSSTMCSGSTAIIDGPTKGHCTLAAGSSTTPTSFVVTSNGGVSTSNAATVAYAGVPTVTAAYAVSACTNGGTVVNSLTSALSQTSGYPTLTSCATGGGGNIIIWGTNFFSGATVTAGGNLCTATPTVDASNTFLYCTLADSSTGIGGTIIVNSRGGASTSNAATISYLTNSFKTNPSVLTTAQYTVSAASGSTQFQISYGATYAGHMWVVVLSHGSGSPPSDIASLVSKGNAGPVANSVHCAGHANVVAGTGLVFSVPCGNDQVLGSATSVDIYAYIDSGTGTSTGLGTYFTSISTTNVFCHSDCSTCTVANDLAHCNTCKDSTNNLSPSGGPGQCCHASCTTCSATTTSTTADLCLACNTLSVATTGFNAKKSISSGNTYDTSSVTALNGFTIIPYLRKTTDGANTHYPVALKSGAVTSQTQISFGFTSQGYCCYPGCYACNDGGLDNACTQCPGHATLQGGKCLGGPINPGNTVDKAEIHGDPHFRGFLGQEYSVTGAPDTVYNIITDTNLQYNAFFIWFGDVYTGRDSTDNTTYNATVTYLGQVALKVRTPGTNKEHRIVYHSSHQLFIDSVEVKGFSAEPIVISKAVSVIFTAKLVTIQTSRFTILLHVAGSHKGAYINQEVRVNDWDDIASHGLLGQTWQRLPAKLYPRDAVWREHIPGRDFMWRQASFLDGHLVDYQLPSNDIFGDDFRFNRYKSTQSGA